MPDTTTLASLENGTGARVSRIEGGAAALKRFSAMGLMPGCQVFKEAGDSHGPVVVQVCGARLAIGRGMASKIIVELGK